MMIDDNDDDTLGPLVSPPDRASFELPRAPDIGSCKPPFQCDSNNQHRCRCHIGHWKDKQVPSMWFNRTHNLRRPTKTFGIMLVKKITFFRRRYTWWLNIKKVRSYASYFVDVVFKDEQKKKLLKVGKMFESCKKLLKDVLQAALTCSKTDPFLSPPSSPTQLTISTTFLHFS